MSSSLFFRLPDEPLLELVGVGFSGDETAGACGVDFRTEFDVSVSAIGSTSVAAVVDDTGRLFFRIKFGVLLRDDGLAASRNDCADCWAAKLVAERPACCACRSGAAS